MNVQCRREGLCLIVSITGELDHHTCESARHIIDDEYNQQGALHIIFDFHKIDFMDSSGIGLIMGRYNLMKELEGELVVAKTGPATERILRLAGLDRMVQINDGNAAKNERRAGNGRQKRKI